MTFPSPAATLFDAVPSNDGTTIFFTGILDDGNGAVFSGAAGGAPGARLGTGTFVLPAAIALGSDGTTLYVADLGADPDVPGVSQKGRVFTVTTAGGTVGTLAGLDGFGVRGLAVRKAGLVDELVVSGTNPTTGASGIFKADSVTGAATLLTAAGDVREPSGVTVVGNEIFVVDASTTGGSTLVRISATNVVTKTALTIPVGFPAGITAAAGDTSLLLSSATTSNVITFDIAAGTFSKTVVPLAIGTEGGGLHKAAGAPVYALVDGTANGTGAVYVLAP